MLGPHVGVAAWPAPSLQNFKVRFVADLSEMGPAVDFGQNLDHVLSHVNRRLLHYIENAEDVELRNPLGLPGAFGGDLPIGGSDRYAP
jgi:hypothetical protein